MDTSRLRRSDRYARALLGAVALCALFALGGIVAVLFERAMPALREVGLIPIITGREWQPTYSEPQFGALPLITASLVVTVGAMAIAVPFGVASAVTISQLMPARARSLAKPVVELLAGLPSVVYGLWGMQFVAPAIMRIFNLPTGQTALSAAVVLGIMALPTVTSIAEDALSSVPRAYKEGSLALGATRWETISKIVFPAARSGVTTAILLGVGRAIGETMAVLMVAGGAAVMPTSLLSPVRPITSAIAAEMGETPVGSVHYHALFVLASILLLITLAFNIVAQYLSRRRAK